MQVFKSRRKWNEIIIGGVIIGIILISSFAFRKINERNSNLESPMPLEVDNNITAHRGAYRIHGTPGNSIAAFQDAIDMRLYGIECDIQLSKDNQLVVYHNLKFHGLEIANSTYSELKGAGKLKNGEDLPLFKDFLKTALDGKYTRIWVDVKSVPKPLGGELRAANACITAMNQAREMKAENFIAGFLIRANYIMKKAIKVSKNEFDLAFQQSVSPSEYVAKGYTWGSQPLGNFYPDNAKGLKEFKDAGVKMNVYEVNKPEVGRWFFEHNVEMIQSDYPDMLLKVLDSVRNNK